MKMETTIFINKFPHIVEFEAEWIADFLTVREIGIVENKIDNTFDDFEDFSEEWQERISEACEMECQSMSHNEPCFMEPEVALGL